MSVQTFNDLYTQAMEYHGRQEWANALDVLTREGERFPDDAPTVLYLRSCMAMRIEQPDLALRLIQEALDRGYWYGEQVMRESPSWQPLQGVPEFERLVEINKVRQEEFRTKPQLFIQEPEGACAEDRTCPLFIALHGNNSNAGQTLHGWRAIVEQGWLLAVPQSSQAMMVHAFLWNDQETALREIEEHYARLRKEYRFDQEQSVIAGFSMGGETALRASLLGTLPVRGFVLLGPGGDTMANPEAWLPLIEGAMDRGLRGYIFVGDREPQQYQEDIRTTAELLDANGIPTKLETIPGIAHVYPEDFGPYLSRALAFVLARDNND